MLCYKSGIRGYSPVARMLSRCSWAREPIWRPGIKEIESNGGCAIHATADATKLKELETMRQQIEHQLGPVDVLVANAGGG